MFFFLTQQVDLFVFIYICVTVHDSVKLSVWLCMVRVLDFLKSHFLVTCTRLLFFTMFKFMVITSFTEGSFKELHISNHNHMQRHGNVCYDLRHSKVAKFSNYDRMWRHGICLGLPWTHVYPQSFYLFPLHSFNKYAKIYFCGKYLYKYIVYYL